MKKTKQLLTFLLIILVTLGLVGCEDELKDDLSNIEDNINDSGNTDVDGTKEPENSDEGNTTNQDDNKLDPVDPEDLGIGTVNPNKKFELVSYGGWLESLYVEWKNIDKVDGYNVYYKEKDTNSILYVKVDNELIRTYNDYSRVDILGLKAGKYDVKIAVVENKVETAEVIELSNFNVENYPREGYGFVNGTSSGAYNDDGTLKNNANVIYVTNTNKNKVTLEINGSPISGLQNILTAYKKVSIPLCVRMIGNITDFSSMLDGDIVIQSNNITMEGVGKDTVANGWGLRIKNASNVEIRNIGFMLVDSSEGDDLGLQQANDHVWVHNCDFFYGKAGKDADQGKGDGALDTKKSMHVTHSYNHFWDTGKSNLVGNKETIDKQNYLTFHHNWYDHSDSRHPRVRVATVHVYNNLFDGISKYGVAATLGSSIFVESNVFKDTTKPIVSSKQGTDAISATMFKENGGMIKAYNNKLVGTTTPFITQNESSTSFDAIIVNNRNDIISSDYKTLVGGTTYNNFDSASDMYKYVPTDINDVESNVKNYAGRIQGGDFTFEFLEASDDTSYAVNTALMAKLLAYKGSVLYIGGVAVDDEN